jgi:cysteine synthase A
MQIARVHESTVDSFVYPRLIQVEPNLYAAAFRLMKLLPARFSLERARAAGLLSKDTVVIETSSGTFGLALAEVCCLLRRRLILVSDPAVDAALQRRIEDLGAEVEIVRREAPVGGIQGARLERVAQLKLEHPDHFCPDQYGNPWNPGSYAPVAEQIAETLGEVDCVVGTVGSGGSMCGLGKFLRAVSPHLRLVGVDTLGSVLFGQPNGKRLLRGLGNSIMPKNLDHTAFDEVHWVSAREGYSATRVLHQRHAMFMGPTSGAAYLVARHWARANPGAKVVMLLADEGARYSDTAYDDAWLRENDLYAEAWALPAEPRRVSHPHEASRGWSMVDWRRRSYDEVVRAGAAEARV